MEVEPVGTKKPMLNFVECESVEEANTIDMEEYRLISYSDRRGVYIFTRRIRK